MLSIKKIGKVTQRYRHIVRYRQIIGIILKYGFENILDAMNIEQFIESGRRLMPFTSTQGEKLEKFNRNQRIRMALEELGPTFIKMGQVLSSRPDLVPVALTAELAKLQDEIPGFEFDQVEAIISSEFGIPREKIFQEFEPAPFASASIGQVHRARLMTGEEVAVKVQRPGIRRTIEADLEIMHYLAKVMENNIQEIAFFKPVRIVEEFAKTLEKELDYTLEAGNMERMGLQFKHDHSLHIPRVHMAHTSERVLTMEFIDGIKASDIDAIDAAGLDRRRITRRGADFIMKQVFEHGFFHADPHPGNIFILKDSRICPVDFGMTGFVDQTTREIFVEMVHGVARGKAARVARLLCEICEYERLPDMAALEKEISEFISIHLTRSLREIRTARMVNQFLEICAGFHLRLPPDLFLMMKAFISIEGVARSLDPEFNMVGHAVPYVTRAQYKRYNPNRIAEEVMGVARDSYRLMQSLPADTGQILEQIKEGKLKATIRVEGLDKVVETQDHTNNRISFAIIIAALILGSAIVVHSNAPPLLFGVSVIGIGAFSAAAVMGVWLLAAIIRSGRL
ncbi:MAG: AarF/UbiB family protein [Desulfobacterales bacterium]|nr:AarF/UbiB family protein [Desulfobacterales bacterium]